MTSVPTSNAGSVPLAVSMGDPAGIGPDIVLRAIDMAGGSIPAFVVYGDPEVLSARAAALASRIAIVDGRTAGGGAGSGRQVRVVPVPCPGPVVAGKPDSANGSAVIAAIEQGTEAVLRGDASALVTCPISKETLYATGFRYPGHTEFLEALARQHRPEEPAKSVMMLASDALRVVPLTIHIPLADVARRITASLIEETARIVDRDTRRYFGIQRPRIAVAGLNPHAGEGGTIGREEAAIIAPAVERLRAEGLGIFGPLSADTLFHEAARARYDVAICMYHDQALIPIKTLAFDTGVNVTLGLPFVRTSPDHGTAFDIAGSGKASPESFVAALRLAADMAGRS